MTILLAHHVTAQHVPVLAAIFVAGVWIGLRLVNKFARRGK
jgi:hypothetical protein